MSTVSASPLTTPETLSDELIQHYRENGFVKIPGVITPEEAAHYSEAAMRLQKKWEAGEEKRGGDVFSQMVNVWQEDDTMKELTLHPNVAGVASKLSGLALRLWHDHILIKRPHNNAPTEFHQDQPYWPHGNQQQMNPLSAWIALVDVPVERGCMTFIPKSHTRKDLESQDLKDSRSLFGKAPDMEWDPRVTLPLKAGDCTFHHGRCAHMATPNFTDEYRVAHIIIYMDADTVYDDIKSHIVTKPLGLKTGDPLVGDLFPKLPLD